MDHSWMNALRTSEEYENGVENFIEFARRNVPAKNGTAIPIPDAEVATIAQARGSFILWPVHLIGLLLQTPPMNEQEAEKWPFLARLQHIYKGIRQIDLHMPPGIVGQNTEYHFTIDKQDLQQFMKFEELDIGWGKFAILSFRRICIDSQKVDLYGFLSPAHTTRVENTLKRRTNYVGFTLSEDEYSCYLAPIVQGYHWSLCVICHRSHVVYWFDSLNRRPDKETKSVFNHACTTYRALGGPRERRGGKDPRWLFPKCPRQPGGWECGYYVLLYMFNIIQSGITTDFEQIFDNEDAYSYEDLNMIRDFMAGHLLQRVPEE